MNKLMIKFVALVMLSSCVLYHVDGAASACSAPTGRCCCDGDAGDDPAKATGVNACVAAAGSCTATAVADAPAASCNVNYGLASGTCTQCARGFSAAAAGTAACAVCAQDKHASAVGSGCDGDKTGTPSAALLLGCRVFGEVGATTCVVGKDGFASDGTPCPVGQWSANGSSCAAVTSAPTTGHLANCRSFGEVGSTTCKVAKNGFHIVSGTVMPCDQDQYSLNGSACAATTGTANAANAADCKSYDGADKGTANCASAKAGKVLVSGAFRSCVANCDECDTSTPASSPTAATCTKAKAGFYIE